MYKNNLETCFKFRNDLRFSLILSIHINLYITHTDQRMMRMFTFMYVVWVSCYVYIMCIYCIIWMVCGMRMVCSIVSTKNIKLECINKMRLTCRYIFDNEISIFRCRHNLYILFLLSFLSSLLIFYKYLFFLRSALIYFYFWLLKENENEIKREMKTEKRDGNWVKPRTIFPLTFELIHIKWKENWQRSTSKSSFAIFNFRFKWISIVRLFI